MAALGLRLRKTHNPRKGPGLQPCGCTLGQVLTFPRSSPHRIPNSSRWFCFVFFLVLVMKQNQSFKKGGWSIPAGLSPQVDAKSLRTLPLKSYLQAWTDKSRSYLPFLQPFLEGQSQCQLPLGRCRLHHLPQPHDELHFTRKLKHWEAAYQAELGCAEGPATRTPTPTPPKHPNSLKPSHSTYLESLRERVVSEEAVLREPVPVNDRNEVWCRAACVASW